MFEQSRFLQAAAILYAKTESLLAPYKLACSRHIEVTLITFSKCWSWSLSQQPNCNYNWETFLKTTVTTPGSTRVCLYFFSGLLFTHELHLSLPGPSSIFNATFILY